MWFWLVSPHISTHYHSLHPYGDAEAKAEETYRPARGKKITQDDLCPLELPFLLGSSPEHFFL